MKKIRIGSRDSKLAVAQSQIVIDIINKYCPYYETELITLKTTGDKILDKTLDKIGGKGLFVKELDEALLNGGVDITVHSLKDMPMQIDERLPIAAYTRCLSPYDVLVLPNDADSIDFDKPIGSSSLRRIMQLKNVYPNADFKPVRGNVLTRLKRLDSGEFSALVLAYAGLARLGLQHRISKVFDEYDVVPAAGQGVLAVQKRQGEDFDFMRYINDENAEICAKTERSFVKALDGGCTSPTAAFAKIDGEKITLRGFYAENGNSAVKEIEGSKQDCEEIGTKLAELVKKAVR